MKDVTIGAAARQAGIGVETIRFYERRGLIEQPPKPLGAGFRVYSPEQIRRIKFIRQAQRIGFSLNETKELLSLRADPRADCSAVRDQAEAKLEEVRHKIEQLQQIGAALETLIATCPGSGELDTCSILDTLADPGRGGVRLVAPASPKPQRHRRAS
jgi:MerR family mercuric resistance operon transcriptional regulator